MFRYVSSTALVCVTAMSAQAQDLSYAAASIDYRSASIHDSELATTAFSGAVEGTYDSFYVGAIATFQSFDFSIDSLANEIEATDYSLSLGYFITPEILVGASVSGAKLDGFMMSDTVSGYEVFGQYVTDRFGVGLTYVEPNTDIDDFSVIQLVGTAEVAAGFDVTALVESYEVSESESYYLGAGYTTGPVTARGYLLGSSDTEDKLYGVIGGYEIGSGISLTASYETATDSVVSADYYAVSVGAGYEVVPGVRVDGRVGRFSVDGGSEFDTFGFSVSYEMGDRIRLSRSVVEQARDDITKGFFGILPTAGIGSILGGNI